MFKILAITLNDLRVFFRERGTLVGLILVPIVLTFAVGSGNAAMSGSGPTDVRVDVVDLDQTATSQQLLDNIRAANNSLRLCPFDDGEDGFCQLGDNQTLDEARSGERLVNNTALALIVIPEGFGAKVTAGEPVNIIYRSNDSAAAPGYILQAVQAAVQRMGGAQVATEIGMQVADSFELLQFRDAGDRDRFRQAIYDSASALWANTPVTVDMKQSDKAMEQQISGTQAGFGQSVPGMGSMFAMMTVLGSLFFLVRERINWTLPRLITMPVTRSQILAGKILTWFIIGIVQYLVVFAIGLIMGLNFGNDLVAIALVMVAFTLCVTAMAFAIATVLKTEAQANSVGLLMALTLAPLGGAWWPLDVVPEFMRIIGHLSPIAWAMDSFRVLLFEKGTLVSVLGNIGLLVALAGVFFVIAVRRFRYD